MKVCNGWIWSDVLVGWSKIFITAGIGAVVQEQKPGEWTIVTDHDIGADTKYATAQEAMDAADTLVESLAPKDR
jgi:hypothetical protein